MKNNISEFIYSEDIDKILSNLPPATGNYFSPLGKHSATITPMSKVEKNQYPKINWELEIVEIGYILRFSEQLYNLKVLPYIKLRFLTLGIKVKTVRDIIKAIESLHFAIIDIDIILLDSGKRAINFLGYTNAETLDKTTTESEYYPKGYRYKNSRFVPAK